MTATTTSIDPAPADRPGRRPEDEYLGLGRTVGYGLQHILAMFGGVIAVPLIVGGAAGLDTAQKALLVACGLFVSGLATMLQTLGAPFFGSRLPLVQGTSFATVSTLLTILAGDGEHGLRVAFGSLLVAAAIGLAITPFFARIIRFFPPVVTGRSSRSSDCRSCRSRPDGSRVRVRRPSAASRFPQRVSPRRPTSPSRCSRSSW